ncbi:MAG TPA: ATP-binding cassette domain-containing protein [Acidobacteriota bacterium]|nr:ATP-binding cassette domain-containing protein [Acidobacteriota bacterium]
MTGIRFEEVTKAYGSRKVLDRFSMTVHPGEMKIVLGGSGSGKSTILKTVLGLVKPDTGRVYLGDQDISQMDEKDLLQIRGEIGMVFQSGALFDSLTVGENVAFKLREQRKLSDEIIQKNVEEKLGFVGLQETADKMPSDLSGGMRRRVAIARSLVGSPKIMLYDEPTAGLDPITGRTICELVMRLRDLEQVTSVFVTHDLSAAKTIARETAKQSQDGTISFRVRNSEASGSTRFVMLSKGAILLEGTEEDLSTTDDKYIREFLD